MSNPIIDQIRKQFKQEWLLIAIDEMDPAVPTIQKGHLLAHSPRREDMYEEMLRHKGPTIVTYSEDGPPPGYALAF